MQRTVHVHTVVPAHGIDGPVALQVLPGDDRDARALLVLARHPSHARALVDRLAAGFLAEATSIEAWMSVVRGAVTEVERTQGDEVDLALLVVTPPAAGVLTRGSGVFAVTDEAGELSIDPRSDGVPADTSIPGRHTPVIWETAPGEVLGLGLQDGLGSWPPALVACLPELFDRTPRPSAARRAAAALAADDGVLLLARIHDLRPRPASVPVRRGGRTRATVAGVALAGLVAFTLLLRGLVGGDDTRDLAGGTGVHSDGSPAGVVAPADMPTDRAGTDPVAAAEDAARDPSTAGRPGTATPDAPKTDPTTPPTPGGDPRGAPGEPVLTERDHPDAADDPRAPSAPGSGPPRTRAAATDAGRAAATASGMPADPGPRRIAAGPPPTPVHGWRSSLPAPPSGPSVTMGDLLVIPLQDARLAVLDPVSGGLVAIHDVDGAPGATLRAAGSTLLVPGTDGRLRAIEPATGAVRWTHDLGGAVDAITHAGSRVWAAREGLLRCLDLESGDRRWERRVASGPVTGIDVASGIGAVATADGTLIAFTPASGKERWRVELPDRPIGRPRVTRTGVFQATAAGVACYRLYRGHLRWQTEVPAMTGARLHAGGLYFGTLDGNVVALDPETGETRWKQPAGDRPLAGLMADGLHLVTVSTDGALRRLDCDDGQPVDRRRLRAEPLSPPVVTGGRLIAVTAGGSVEALAWRVRPS